MDLDDLELYWTRRDKGLASEKETERYIKGLEKQVNKLKEKNEKLERKNKTLKDLFTKATEIIDEYTIDIENDTKKLIEYQKKYLNKEN